MLKHPVGLQFYLEVRHRENTKAGSRARIEKGTRYAVSERLVFRERTPKTSFLIV